MPEDRFLATALAIGLAALVTYSLRFGGLLLAGRLPQKGRICRGMEALPGAIILSLVAPSILNAGWFGFLAAGATAAVTRITGNVFIAMLVGMGIIFAQRQMGL